MTPSPPRVFAALAREALGDAVRRRIVLAIARFPRMSWLAGLHVPAAEARGAATAAARARRAAVSFMVTWRSVEVEAVCLVCGLG